MAIQIDGNGIINGNIRQNAAIGSAGSVGFRNKLLNATYIFQHRAQNLTLSAGQYSLDRWKAGTSGCTWSRTLVGNAQQLTISSGSKLQIIEAWHIEGGTYCLSWTGTAQARVNGGAYGNSGMTVNVTAYTDTTIEFGPGTVYQPQFELGTMPTVFEQRPIPFERSLLTRYYWTTTTNSLNSIVKVSTGFSNFAGSQPQIIQFPQLMRASPTVTFYTDNARSNPGNVMKNGTTVTAIGTGLSTEITAGGLKYWLTSSYTAAGDYANFACDFDAEL